MAGRKRYDRRELDGIYTGRRMARVVCLEPVSANQCDSAHAVLGPNACGQVHNLDVPRFRSLVISMSLPTLSKYLHLSQQSQPIIEQRKSRMYRRY